MRLSAALSEKPALRSMASCSAITGSSRKTRRCHERDALATCCSTSRKASSGPPRTKSRPTSGGGRSASAAPAPPPNPASAHPTCRTRNAVASSGEWMRSRRSSRPSLTPRSRAIPSPAARDAGRTSSRKEPTERIPGGCDDPAVPPATCGRSRSTRVGRENQRRREMRRVLPAHVAIPETTSSRVIRRTPAAPRGGA